MARPALFVPSLGKLVKQRAMVTPLQPREFFRGVWSGQGELVPHPLLRWFARRESIRFSSEAIWLSETVWMVKDHFEFSSGRVLGRKMFAELTAPDRIHLTADDMPLGADILLYEKGFRFTPYFILVSYLGRVFRLRCLDECAMDANGFIHDTIRMYFWTFPVATMRLGPIDRNAG